jgi:hypothetical protein
MPSNSDTSIGIMFARIFWMMVGPLLLVLLFFMIVRIGISWWTMADLAFFGVLVGVIVTRWLEFLAGNPQTAAGEPATPAHLQRFVIVTLSLGIGGWVIANILGNHLLTN